VRSAIRRRSSLVRRRASKDKLGKIGRGIDNRLGKGSQARAGALHVTGDEQKIGRVAREAINGRNDDNISTRVRERPRMAESSRGERHSEARAMLDNRSA
jgi:hypothetical protein